MQAEATQRPTPDRDLLDRGDIRLLQAYLRMLGHYGDPTQVRGVDVVDGDYGLRTQHAVAQFARATGNRYSQLNDDLLDDVRQHYQRTLLHSAQGTGSPLAALDKAFRQHYARSGDLWRQLHPAMRFPLLSAIDDLRRQGVEVSLMDGRRSRAQQEEHVREGRSTAPPGASFHDYGLAIDLAPRTDGMNPDNPAWNRIFSTMQRYGFYSLYRQQGWDRPHFELPASTPDMMRWPRDIQGWKNIPAQTLPAAWQRINTQALTRLSAVDVDEHSSPLPTPRLVGASGVSYP